MRGRVNAIRTFKGLVADLRFIKIIGIKLKTGRSSVIKKLHEGHSILSASTMEPSEQNIWKWMDNEQDEGENS